MLYVVVFVGFFCSSLFYFFLLLLLPSSSLLLQHAPFPSTDHHAGKVKYRTATNCVFGCELCPQCDCTMSSLVIDFATPTKMTETAARPFCLRVYEQNEVFEKKVLHFFEEFPLVKRSSSDVEMNELLVANCNTLTNMKKNVFPDILSFIDAAGLRIEESLDGFFAKSGACQFASIAYHLYNKSFEHNFRPDLLLREMAVNVIATNPHEYHQYLEPAVVHLRTRSTKKAAGQSINMQEYLRSMRKPAVDGDSVTPQALADFFKFKVRVLKWGNGKPVVLTTASSPERLIQTPFISLDTTQWTRHINVLSVLFF